MWWHDQVLTLKDIWVFHCNPSASTQRFWRWACRHPTLALKLRLRISLSEIKQTAGRWRRRPGLKHLLIILFRKHLVWRMFSHAFPQTLTVGVKLNESIIHPLIFIYLMREHLQSVCLSLRPSLCQLALDKVGGFSKWPHHGSGSPQVSALPLFASLYAPLKSCHWRSPIFLLSSLITIGKFSLLHLHLFIVMCIKCRM